MWKHNNIKATVQAVLSHYTNIKKELESQKNYTQLKSPTQADSYIHDKLIFIS